MTIHLEQRPTLEEIQEKRKIAFEKKLKAKLKEKHGKEIEVALFNADSNKQQGFALNFYGIKSDLI